MSKFRRDISKRIVAAYLLDRADQYVTSSPCWVALSDAAHGIMNDEAAKSFRDGEFDSKLMARVDGMRDDADTPKVEPTMGCNDTGDADDA